jgi:hypothetical protein
MSENTANAPVAKNRRGKLWLIIGAGIVLVIAYQSGRSSGVRSAMEFPPPMTNMITPVDSSGAVPLVPPTATPVRATVNFPPAALPESQIPATRHQRIPLEPPTDPPGGAIRPAQIRPTAMTTPLPDNSPARIGIPTHSPVDTLLRPPQRMIETGPATVFQTGHNNGQIATRPSQTGLMPLEPLPTIPPGASSTSATQRQPVTQRQPAAAPQLAPLVPVRSISTCDCGVAH